MLRHILAILVAVVLVGCATAPTTPPSGTPTAEIGFLSPGTKWKSRIVTSGSYGASDRVTTFTVLEDRVYAGRPVHQVTDGVDTFLSDRATRSYVATLRDGTETAVATPHNGALTSPLWKGKWWKASYAFEDRAAGRSWNPIETTWAVEAYEDVVVPAGTFKAFRLQSTPGLNDGVYITRWYAPETKLIVKQIVERASHHFRGAGKSTTEVVEFPAKQ